MAKNEYESSSSALVQLDLFNTPKNLFDKITVNFFCFTCFTMIVLLTTITCAVTFFRYVLQGDLYGYEEWVKLFAFWLYFAGAAAGAWARTHISADLINVYVKRGLLRDGLIFLRNLITFSVCAVFTWYAWKFFYFGYSGPLGTGIAIPKTTIWRIPYWVGYLSVFTGIGFMTFYFCRDFIISARYLLKRSHK